MKRKRNCFYSIITVCSILATTVAGYGQGKNIEKTYRWTYNGDQHMSFTFSNYDCNLTIHTWDRPDIEYAMTVDAALKTEEDAGILDQYIEDLKFSNASGGARFDNRFWSNRVSNPLKKTMTLKGGKTIRYVEFNMEGEMWIPENCILHLNSKYSEIEAEDLSGDVYLDLYNDKLFGSNVNSKMKVTAKYCTLEFEKMKDIEADLYNTDIETGDIGNLDIQSKYSTLEMGDAGRLNINAYNDNYKFGNTGDIRFTDKYSDLNVLNAGDMELNCYNSTVNISKVNEVDLTSKYGKYEINRISKLNISTAYNDNFRIEELDHLGINESKYSVFKLDDLERSLLLKDGYSDKFQIEQTGTLEEVKVNGKYVDLQMAIGKSLNYRFKASVKYGKLDINEEAMDVKKKIQDGSQLDMEAIKGTEKDGMLTFFVNGYDIAVTLTEQ